MNTSYTPGPWKTAQRTTRGEFVTETHIYSANGSHIAEVRPNQIDANARLIAAAPDLLEALNGIMSGIGDGCECLDGEAKRHCFFCLARAAIEKAEGKE